MCCRTILGRRFIATAASVLALGRESAASPPRKCEWSLVHSIHGALPARPHASSGISLAAALRPCSSWCLEPRRRAAPILASRSYRTAWVRCPVLSTHRSARRVPRGSPQGAADCTTAGSAGLRSGGHKFRGWPSRKAYLRRKAGRDEGFRIVGRQAQRIRRLSRRTAEVWVPKAGWVRFRWSRAVTSGAKSSVTLTIWLARSICGHPFSDSGTRHWSDCRRGPGRYGECGPVHGLDLLRVPRLSPQRERRLRMLQRRLARAERGSRRRVRRRGASLRDSTCARLTFARITD